jgi:hypothetical protein
MPVSPSLKDFVGRRAELAALERHYAAGRSGLLERSRIGVERQRGQ